MSKQWNEMAASEKRQGITTLVVVSVFLLVWISSGFLTALGLSLVGLSLYFIYRTLRYKGSRLKSGVIALGLLVASGLVLPDTPQTTSQTQSVSEQTVPEKTDEELAAIAKLAAEQKAREEKEAEEKRVKEASAQQLQPTGDLYRVTSITDGDTIKVDIGGRIETVRFIGMDTPETKDPRKPVQCFGQEASSKMQSFAQSKYVRLEADASQGDRDKYGRLLRYVYLEDGRNIAYEMIKGGYAHEYTYKVPYKYQEQFKAALAHARSVNAGLWSPQTCAGNTDQQHPPAPVAQPRATAPSPQSTPAPQAAAPSSVYYKNCTAARAAGAAPVYEGQPGYGTHLDRDRDGIGCE